MKKYFVVASLFCSSILAQADFIPGSYVGTGMWETSEGLSGRYGASVEVTADGMQSIYTFDQEKIESGFKIVKTAGAFFDVVMADKVVGQGYCFEVQCHYEIKAGDFEMEETLTFYQGRLYKIGSKIEKATKVLWTDMLTLNEEV